MFNAANDNARPLSAPEFIILAFVVVTTIAAAAVGL
jgi:hypothetical protein